MNTATHEHAKHVSVPSGEGVRVDQAITIQRPIAEVYSFWRRFENLPRFMRHLQSVRIIDALHSHWAAKTFGDKVLEWDAEIIEQRENEMISWRSVPGADVGNAGSVWFTPVPSGEGTMVRVEMKYVPPAGKAGALVAKAFGRDADKEIAEDLRRLKSLLETGRLPAEETSNRLGRAKQAARRTAQKYETCVRENPWKTVGIVALCGTVLGLVMGWSMRSSQRARLKSEGLC